ncbi:MAG: hypothetical protein QXQ48_09485 [Nitrososphaerota archaeon]
MRRSGIGTKLRDGSGSLKTEPKSIEEIATAIALTHNILLNTQREEM